MFCQRNTRMVHAVQEQYPDIFSVDFLPAMEHKAELQKYELGSHGVICLANDGEVLWRHPGHNMTQASLDAGVQEILHALGKG